MTTLTFTQLLRNKELHAAAVAKAKLVTATVNGPALRRAKWDFKVLAFVTSLEGDKVETFQDYTFASKWAQSFGGGSVYPIEAIADYTSTSVTLKGGMAVEKPTIEPYQLDLI